MKKRRNGNAGENLRETKVSGKCHAHRPNCEHRAEGQKPSGGNEGWQLALDLGGDAVLPKMDRHNVLSLAHTGLVPAIYANSGPPLRPTDDWHSGLCRNSNAIEKRRKRRLIEGSTHNNPITQIDKRNENLLREERPKRGGGGQQMTKNGRIAKERMSI
jgi:hypothetical protein